MELSKLGLSGGIALIGGGGEQRDACSGILLYPAAQFVHLAEQVFGVGASCISERFHNNECFFVAAVVIGFLGLLN